MKLRYWGLDNRQATLTVAGEYAALLAHEIDHLDGVLYIDHI
jgi:peptide deformylase